MQIIHPFRTFCSEDYFPEGVFINRAGTRQLSYDEVSSIIVTVQETFCQAQAQVRLLLRLLLRLSLWLALAAFHQYNF